MHILTSPLLAYVGPDTMLPLVSVVASVVGGVLLMWKWIVAFFARAWRATFARGSAASAAAGAAVAEHEGSLDDDAGRPGAAR